MSALPKPIPADVGRWPEPMRFAGAREFGAWSAREWRMAPWTARAAVIVLAVFYLFAAASPLIAPYNPARQYRNLPDCPPMRLHFSARAEWQHGLLFAYPMTMGDPLTRTYVEDHSRKTYIRLFHRGHLFTTESASDPYFMLGSEALGRDLFSRIVYGARVSMCIGLVGVLISFSLGIGVGAFSGLVGGTTDDLIMRLCEIEMSLPSFYFLLALAAVIPSGMSPVATFFMIVAIMSFISWAGFARVIRGMAAAIPIGAVCGGWPCAWRVARALAHASYYPVGAWVRGGERLTIDSRLYPWGERAFVARTRNSRTGGELGQPALAGNGPAKPRALSMGAAARYVHFVGGNGV